MIATYTNECQVGHSELCLVIGFEIARYCHGEVLLRLVLRRWERRELGVVGAQVEGGAEYIEWVRTVATLGTLQHRDHNRNVLGARQAVLPVCTLF